MYESVVQFFRLNKIPLWSSNHSNLLVFGYNAFFFTNFHDLCFFVVKLNFCGILNLEDQVSQGSNIEKKIVYSFLILGNLNIFYPIF